MRQGINIWSGQRGLGAALTNPTELAFQKRNLQFHYPVTFRGQTFPDAESAYQFYKTGAVEADTQLMIEVLMAKFEQYPQLVEAIARRSGVNWLELCRHQVTSNRHSRWEGKGLNSRFIRCLIAAYERVR